MNRSIPAAAFLALAACNSEPAQNAQAANATLNAAETAVNTVDALEDQPPAPAPKNAAAGEAGQDEYSWTLFRSGGASGFPVLIYGARSNDEVVINFQCRKPGEVTVIQLRDALGEARDGPIVLQSGGQRLRLEVTLGPDGGDGNTPAAAMLAAGHPLLQAFRSTGALSVANGNRSRSADAVDAAEKATIERFFADCAG